MLRHTAAFSRWVHAVMAWFALTLVVAVASPLVHQAALQAICDSDGGIRYIASDVVHAGVPLHHEGQGESQVEGDSRDSQVDGHVHDLQCPLCLAVKEPPSAEFDVEAHLQDPLAYALSPFASAEIEARAGAPLPPRGPPSTEI